MKLYRLYDVISDIELIRSEEECKDAWGIVEWYRVLDAGDERFLIEELSIEKTLQVLEKKLGPCAAN